MMSGWCGAPGASLSPLGVNEALAKTNVSLSPWFHLRIRSHVVFTLCPASRTCFRKEFNALSRYSWKLFPSMAHAFITKPYVGPSVGQLDTAVVARSRINLSIV